MKTKILKVKTLGSREKGNLRPEISDDLPEGVNLVVLEYGSNFAIVKLTWSNHPLATQPQLVKLEQTLAHSSIIETVASHPKANKLKTTFGIVSVKIDEEKIGKKIRIGVKEGSFLRKEMIRGEDTYIIDEG